MDVSAVTTPIVRAARSKPPVASARMPKPAMPITAPSTPANVIQPASVARIRVGTSSAPRAPVGGANALDEAIASR